MDIKCFKREFGNHVIYMPKSGTESLKYDLVLDFLKKSLKEDNINEEIVNIINRGLERIVKITQRFNNVLSLKEAIKNKLESSTENNENTLDKLVENTKLSFRKDFIERIFLGNVSIKNKHVKDITCNICNCILFNRTEGKIIPLSEINKYIHKYLEDLFLRLKEHLLTIYEYQHNNELKNAKSLYDEDGNYTGAFEIIKEIARIDPENRLTFNKGSFKYSTPSGILAYVDYQTLLHFDEFMLFLLGDSVKLKDTTKTFSKDRYEIVLSLANQAWSNSKDDDVDLSESINNLSKLLIISTRKHNYNDNQLIDGYLSFDEFKSAITKIKDLATNPNFSNINLLEKNRQRDYIYINKISKKSSDYLKSKGNSYTLLELISDLRDNRFLAISPLFELLCDKDFNKKLNNYFNPIDLITIKSLNEELFSLEKSTLVKAGGKPLEYILHTIDTAFSVKNCSYRENLSQLIKLQELASSAVSSVLRNLESSINSLNDPDINPSFIKDVQVTSKTTQNGNVSITSMKFSLKEIAPDRNIWVKVDRAGKISIIETEVDPKGNTIENEYSESKVNKIIVDNRKDFIKNNQELIKKFIYKVLNLKLDTNNLLENFKIVSNKSNDTTGALLELFQFCSEIIRAKYAVHEANLELLKSDKIITTKNGDVELESKVSRMEKIFNKHIGESHTKKINYTYETMDMIPIKKLNVLENLAVAHAISTGLYNQALEKDSEGKSLAKATTSRLLSGYYMQWRDIKSNKNNPASHFILLNNPEILVDVQTKREIKTDKGSKIFNSLNTKEFAETQILHGFINALVNENVSKHDLLTNGVIDFVASVNSDKSTVSALLINLRTLLENVIEKDNVTVEDVLDFLINSESSYSIDLLIDNELGRFYDKLRIQVLKDFEKLKDTNIWKIYLGDFKLDELTPEKYIEFNQRFAEAKKQIEENPIYQEQFAEELIRRINLVKVEKGSISKFQEKEIRGELLRLFKISGKAPLSMRDFIDLATKESGVVFNLEIHGIFKGDTLLINRSLYSLLTRYNGDEISAKKYSIPTSREFWQLKACDFVQYCINNNVVFNIEDPRILAKLDKFIIGEIYIRKGNWVDASGNLILAKYTYDSKTVNITSEADLRKILSPELDIALGEAKLANNLHLLAKGIKLNPLLENYNKLSYLVTLEWNLSTVGTHVNHPSKAGWPPIINSSEEIPSSFVYNVSAEEYEENPSKYDIQAALNNQILNIISEVALPYGERNDIDNKVFYEKIKIVKNSWESDEASRYLALHKRNVQNTASVYPFGLNIFDGVPSEYNISVIEDIYDLAYNVSGELAKVKPYDGATFVDPCIVYQEIASLGGERAGIHKKLFVHFYIENLGVGGIIKTAGFGLTNSWFRNSPFLERLYKKMSDLPWKDPNSSEEILIDVTRKNQNINGITNRLSYEIFFSEPYKDGDGKWKERYYKAVNLKAIYENGIFTGKYQYDKIEVDEYGDTISFKSTPVITNKLNTNYKIYKELFLGTNCRSIDPRTGKLSKHQHCGEASIKNLAKAQNECVFRRTEKAEFGSSLVDWYLPMKHSNIHYIPTEGAIKQSICNLNGNNTYYDNIELNSFKIKIKFGGIQLDKEHHADDSEISMMTQVISALASKGYSWNESNKVYNALYLLTLLGIAPFTEKLSKIIKEETDSEVTNNLEFQKFITELVVKSLGNGSKDKDGVIYDIALNLINKYKSGQKLTDDDIINNPIAISDSTLFRKVISLVSSTLTSNAIKLKFKGILSVLVPSHENIKLYDGKLRSNFVNFDEEIAEILEQLSAINIVDVRLGRTYFVTDNETGEEIEIHLQAPTILDPKGKYGDPDLIYMGYYEFREKYRDSGKYTIKENVTRGRNLAAFSCSFTDISGENKFNFYDLASVKQLYLQTYKNEADSAAAKKLLQQKVLEDLLMLQMGGSVKVNIDGNEYIIEVTNLEIEPYEVIMPKTMATLLGLTPEDDLYTLVNDRNAFTKKLVHNLKVNKINSSDLYTTVLKRTNGNHTYILSKKLYDQLKHDGKNIEIIESYSPIQNPVDGTIFKPNDSGEFVHEMSSLKDKIALIDGQEVIITDNLNFYLDKFNYDLIQVNSKENLMNILKNSKDIENRAFLNFKNILTWDKDYNKEFIFERHNILNNLPITEDGIISITDDSAKFVNYITSLGDELYASFKKSLDIIAARIPAQSMQSFMPMRVVAYEDFDINTAYVSTHQIWLQGSDYDIDTVSLLTYELNDSGKFVGWSPYFNLSSHEFLQASTTFEYPTGKKLEYKNLEDLFLLLGNISNELWENLDTENLDKILKEYLQEYLRDIFSAFNFVVNKDNVTEIRLKQSDTEEFLSSIEIVNDISKYGLIDPEYIPNELVKNKIKAIKQFVDKHNTYTKNALVYTKNYIVHYMFMVATNPANWTLAQTSVDSTTGALKKIADASELGKLLQKATPGNVMNMLQAIVDNHVGKDVIGISAVGLKSFFAITLFVNTVLHEGDTQNIRRKLLDRPIMFNGVTYKTVANANPGKVIKNDTDLDRVILQVLQDMTSEDLALLISALLSLATDNAKELCLAKLNANASMADMYIFGLTMGIPFDQLGKLLMSDMGNAVASILLENQTTSKYNITNVDKAIKWIDHPMREIRNHYIGVKKPKMDGTFGKSVYTDFVGDYNLSKFSGVFLKDENYYSEEFVNYTNFLKRKQEDSNKKIPSINIFNYLTEWVLPRMGRISVEGIVPVRTLGELEVLVEDTLKILEYYRIKVAGINSEEIALKNKDGKSTKWHIILKNKQLRSLVIDELINAVNLNYKVKSAEFIEDMPKWNDFKLLRKGSSELLTLGYMLGANLGIKNKLEDLLRFIDTFETLHKVTVIDSVGKTSKVDSVKFFEDKEYAETIINAAYQKSYDRNGNLKDPLVRDCVCFNIYDIINTIKHFNGYIYSAVLSHKIQLNGSIKYRTLYKYIPEVKENVGFLKLQDSIKSLEKLIDFKLINDFLISEKIKIEVKNGDKLVTVLEDNSNNGIFRTVESDIIGTSEIILGTLTGNATFKRLVELRIIPDIMKGFNGKDNTSLALVGNKFIDSLRPNVFNNNASRHNSRSYTTNINMSPRSNDTDGKAILEQLQEDFNNLAAVQYYITDDFSMPILDILYLYNLIAYNGKNGESSLNSIFDNYIVTSDLYKRKLKHLVNLDTQLDKALDLTISEILAWAAQTAYPSKYTKAYWRKNKKDLTTELIIMATDEEGNKIPTISGNYSKVNHNLILHPITSQEVEIYEQKIDKVSYILIHNIASNKFELFLNSIEDLTEGKNPLKSTTDLISSNDLQGHVIYDPVKKVHKINTDSFKKLLQQQKECK